MDLISKNLAIIGQCIQNNEYIEIETERFELKNLAGGWGDDWYKSVCAFLNTNGGVIVIGIKDLDNPPKGKPKCYKFHGYQNSKSNENHLTQELPKKFTDKNNKPLDLRNHITKFEIKEFLDGHVAVVYIEELDSEQKYVFYKSKAYTRKLTGDHVLSHAEIEAYEEIKRDIIRHQELAVIQNADLDILNIETLNEYIYEFNQGKKRGETYKKNLEDALPFLTKEGFIINRQPSLLGTLVCADEPERYIQGKCQADCYVIIPNAPQVAQSKEVIEDNIINLIKRSQNFIWRNIQIGIAYTQGGTAKPEYPESLIRESINNAFAQRDYKSDRFVIVEIRPQQSLMIQNPGMFERRQRIHIDTEFGKIRRIIPFQVARNPKLTHLLKSFDYWEGRGRGLTSLINACLDNQVDVPYYILSDEIKLFISKGSVLDDEMNTWLNSFSGYIHNKIGRALSSEERIMLAFFKKSEALNRLNRYTILITADNNHSEVIATLEEQKLIFSNPDSPELYPIYQVERVLMQKDFAKEIEAIFGKRWSELKPEYKDCLNAIYQYNTFGNPDEIISANSIGNFLYATKNNKNINLSKYENFKRRIRNIFNNLEKRGFIVRKEGKTKDEGGKPDFRINTNFTESHDLFNL